MNRTIIALLALSITGCNTTSAEAGWPHNQFENQPRSHRHYRPHRHHHKPKVIYRTAPKVDAPRCASEAITREGDQYATEEGAKQEAKKAWMQAVRWLYGEQMMNPDNALGGKTYSCSRSSVGSVAGQTFIRCDLTARPCRAPKVRE